MLPVRAQRAPVEAERAPERLRAVAAHVVHERAARAARGGHARTAVRVERGLVRERDARAQPAALLVRPLVALGQVLHRGHVERAQLRRRRRRGRVCLLVIVVLVRAADRGRARPRRGARRLLADDGPHGDGVEHARVPQDAVQPAEVLRAWERLAAVLVLVLGGVLFLCARRRRPRGRALSRSGRGPRLARALVGGGWARGVYCGEEGLVRGLQDGGVRRAGGGDELGLRSALELCSPRDGGRCFCRGI